jgi:hypothetical protein
MTEWNIQSRAHACSACGKSFADKEAYHTLLFDERSDFRRLDVCEACWQKQYSEGASERKGFVSYWQGVYECPPPPTEAIQKETAESLLRKLIELNDPRYVSAGYILAVMLERKRVLRVKEQTVRDGKRIFIYEQPKSGDVFTIVDPNLQLNQLEQVQHDVAALLEHGLSSASPTPPPAATNESTIAEGTPQNPAGVPESSESTAEAPSSEAPSPLPTSAEVKEKALEAETASTATPSNPTDETSAASSSS